jgi:hypothetical protein
MVRIFLIGVAAGLLLSPRRKEIATEGIRFGKKISRYVRESGARIMEDWEDAMIEADAPSDEEQESVPGSENTSQSS